MSAAEMPAGAAPERTPDWHSIDWKKVWCTVRRLQARIVKAMDTADNLELLHANCHRQIHVRERPTGPAASREGRS